MSWEVEVTDEFAAWYSQLEPADQDEVIARVDLLEASGPSLGRPVVDTVHQSRHPNMKELRIPRGVRVLFAFDPRRTAILLVGGDKSLRDAGSPDWNKWYRRFVPMADDLYDSHLRQLHDEGLV